MKKYTDSALNELAAAVFASEGAERKRLTEELFIALNDLYGKNDDEMTALGDFFSCDFGRFDPEKGPFMHFVRFFMSKREKDVIRKQIDGMYDKEEETDRETGEKKIRRVYKAMTVTESSEDDEGNEITAIETAENAAARNNHESHTIEQEILQDEWQSGTMLQLMQSISRLFASYTKKNNAVRHQYYLQFFTESVSYILRIAAKPDSVIAGISRKTELWNTLKVGFLDFTLVDRCRTLPDIARSRLKPYGQMVQGKSMVEPPEEEGLRAYIDKEDMEKPKKRREYTGLPLDVHVTYRKEIEHLPATVSTVSENRKAYYELFAQAYESYLR